MSKQNKTALEGLLIHLGLPKGVAYAVARSIDRCHAKGGGADDLASRIWLHFAAAEQSGYNQGLNEQQLMLFSHPRTSEMSDALPRTMQ